LLSDNNLNNDNSDNLTIGEREAADALLAGDIDAAFFVASPQSPVVRRLLESESLKLMSFERADAYTRLHPYLSSVVLPEGVVNMERNLPGNQTRLLSATANMVTTDRLHPALVELLV
jgi:uncharacterized protein